MTGEEFPYYEQTRALGERGDTESLKKLIELFRSHGQEEKARRVEESISYHVKGYDRIVPIHRGSPVTRKIHVKGYLRYRKFDNPRTRAVGGRFDNQKSRKNDSAQRFD